MTGYEKLQDMALAALADELPADELPADGIHQPHKDNGTREDHTDVGNGRRMARLYGGNLRHVHELGWFTWEGKRWQADENGAVRRVAKSTALSFYDDAIESINSAKSLVAVAKSLSESGDDAGANDANERAGKHQAAARRLQKWAVASQAKGKIDAMIELAKSEWPIPARFADFDADHMLLNVANGTIDLRNGQLRPHSRDHLLTKLAPVEYDPAAECPAWLNFLYTIFAGDWALIRFVQQVVGYSLTGLTTEQILLFAYGNGRNGKSTFFEILISLLGDYAQKAPTEMIMRRGDGAIPNDVARLRGARLAVVAEVEEGSRLAEKQVKDLTGGDTLVARYLHHEFFEFAPTHTLWMYGNHKPVIRGTDTGIWRRVQLIPFTVTIAPADVDPFLKNKLAAEMPGILAWAVRGCLDWQQCGLQIPQVVAQATEEYKSESDVLGQFLADGTIRAADQQTKASELYHHYELWCEQAGEKPVSGKRFAMQLAERGIEKHRTKYGNFYMGIAVQVW